MKTGTIDFGGLELQAAIDRLRTHGDAARLAAWFRLHATLAGERIAAQVLAAAAVPPKARTMKPRRQGSSKRGRA